MDMLQANQVLPSLFMPRMGTPSIEEWLALLSQMTGAGQGYSYPSTPDYAMAPMQMGGGGGGGNGAQAFAHQAASALGTGLTGGNGTTTFGGNDGLNVGGTKDGGVNLGGTDGGTKSTGFEGGPSNAPGFSTKYDGIIAEASKKYGVDANLVKSVIKQESQFNPNIRSPKGAAGLMQLMPGTAKMLGVTNITDPRQNIMAGTKYLGQQIQKFGSVQKALAAYNAGPGAVKKYGGVPPYAETRKYISNITKNLATLNAHKTKTTTTKPADTAKKTTTDKTKTDAAKTTDKSTDHAKTDTGGKKESGAGDSKGGGTGGGSKK